METETDIPAWAMGLECAVTVCDADARIIFMNRRARLTYASRGNLLGADLRSCHGPRAVAVIDRLLARGGTNVYTITKGGLRKMIYQCAWTLPSGAVGGLAEISMIIPEDLPHYDRDHPA